MRLYRCGARLATLGAIFAFAACSAAPQSTSIPGTLRVPARAGAHRAHGKLLVRVRVPKRKHRRGRYVSPATQGMTVAIAGPTSIAETVGLSVASNPAGCTSTLTGTLCTLAIPGLAACPSSANCYAATIATYDAISCGGSGCTIPGGAHALSQNQNVGFTIAVGQSNQLAITLDGIPSSVLLIPEAASILAGNDANGYALSKCVTVPQKVDVVGADADGNIILGAGAPVASLASDDATHLAAATPPPSAPNQFALTPPATLSSTTIPNPGTVVHLTAGVTPLAGSGSTTPLSAQTKVTFNSDVCGVVTQYSIDGPGPAFIYQSGDIPVDAAIRRGTKPGWFTERGTRPGTIAADRITEFTAGTTGAPVGIATGADGAMWYALLNSKAVGRMPLAGATAQTYPLPTPAGNPRDVALGSDGALWFTVPNADQIGRIDTTGSITEYSIPTANADPGRIAAGPDGALWFTETCGNQIGRIDTTGAITEYSIPTANARPVGIAAGPDGAMWFTEFAGGGTGTGAIGRIPTTATPGSPNVTEYSTGLSSPSGPEGIAKGPDGTLWFIEACTASIGNVSTAGTIAEYPTGLSSSGQAVGYITPGPDGALWFTYRQNTIARMTTAGEVTTTYTITSSPANPLPLGMVTGPDGALWFTENNSLVNKIGRLQ